MQASMTIGDARATLQANLNRKRDYHVPLSALSVEVGDGDRAPQIGIAAQGAPWLDFTSRSAAQLCEYLGVPTAYFHALVNSSQEGSKIAAKQLQYWLERKRSEDPHASRLVRAIDMEARAVLSPSYARIDNHVVLEAALDGVARIGVERVSTLNAHVTEDALTLNFGFLDIETEVAEVGSVVRAGLSLRANEVGEGAIDVSPLLYVLKCRNGMVMPMQGMRRRHVGARMAAADEAAELSIQTLSLETAAVASRITDVVAKSVRQDVFERNLGLLREAADDKVVSSNGFEWIQKLGKALRLSEPQVGVVWAKLLEEPRPTSRLAVTQALTAAAQTSAFSFADACEIERKAGLYLARHVSLN